MTRCPPNVKCRGVVPAVSHIMLHSDPLANEFNEILNAVEIFAPFQPLEPAISFYAPLQFNTRDLRLSQDTFSRNSEAWYLDGSGIYRRSLNDQARFENGRLLMEPAKTNKCTNYNANPDPEIINVVGGGGTVRRIYNPGDIQAAGLQNICSSGFVVEIENETGGLIGAYVNGTVGNLNPHTVSLWMNTFGASVSLGLSGVGTVPFVTNALERCDYGAVPDNANRVLLLQIDPGDRCQFVLNQLEESPVVTSPIITEGTAGQRSTDNLLYQRPTFSDLFNQSEGVVVADFQPLWNDDDINDQPYIPLLGVNTGSNLLYALHIAGTSGIRFYSFDQVNAPQVRYIGGPVNGELFRVVSHWSAADPNELGIGVYRYSDEQWTWDNRAYNGSFPTNESFYVGNEPALPHRVSGAQVFNQYRDRQWIEDNLTP